MHHRQFDLVFSFGFVFIIWYLPVRCMLTHKGPCLSVSTDTLCNQRTHRAYHTHHTSFKLILNVWFYLFFHVLFRFYFVSVCAFDNLCSSKFIFRGMNVWPIIYLFVKSASQFRIQKQTKKKNEQLFDPIYTFVSEAVGCSSPEY